MKKNLFLFCICFFCLISCQEKDEQHLLEQQKDAKARALVFTTVSNAWHFTIPPLSSNAQSITQNWKELEDFNFELRQIPKSTIGAFQKKSKDLSRKVLALNGTIPAPFNKPAVKSRIAALITKINSINLYLNIDAIPAKKIVVLVTDFNKEYASLYRQFDEIIRKSEIPKEEGESDMIRMLDPTRAIPNTPNKP
jgi:hypothetical protein